ncbi:DUF3859 domain-containing protein [Carboxylicivirga sediminis]|uniref:DUF3859 domain-containing protein n=1 Tax=Carboxylicivirga sediminis TaxID=2006564 RepID=A0A941IYN3_9BACT|nr:DUF3859 domain-containing protein [Carboxylicivirga sediminis]MBR8536773.1 DUF3859 domain-containing protein [Carboxylicivirga sediminis]
MAKKKISWELYSYGEYSSWERQSKALPKLLKITDRVQIRPDLEFGYVLKIKGAKGKKVDFRIEHPPFKNTKGETEPPFVGEYYVNSNDYEFFLGDTVWEPYDDKAGEWRLITMMEGQVLADKVITLCL